MTDKKLDHPSVEIVMAVCDGTARDSIYDVLISVDGQLELSGFYDLDPCEIPGNLTPGIMALWLLRKVADGAQA